MTMRIWLTKRELATQRVGLAHGLDAGESGLPTLLVRGTRHAGEADGARGAQRGNLGATGKVIGQGLIADHHGIATEQLCGITTEAAFDAVGKKCHSTESGHGQGHRHQQDPHAGGAQVATGLCQRPAPGGNGAQKGVNHVCSLSAKACY